MKLRNLIIYFLFIILFTNQSYGKWVDGNFALIQGLDKITARIKTLKINVGERKSFGILNILIKRCVFSKPTETPEAIAYLSVYENKEKQLNLNKKNYVFEGWMFASSPALNAMEHPVYDLSLISCKKSRSTIKGSLPK
ncbi:MAG: cellulase-like protein [SAR116 cluster bacterium]|jgi:hypothetical protein|nr:cellulase-like protein [SAR116 cluster bacterium]